MFQDAEIVFVSSTSALLEEVRGEGYQTLDPAREEEQENNPEPAEAS
jgi:hypothetical protein